MTDIRPVLPRTQAPDLNVATVGGGSWKLADSRPQNFTLVVFYRGLHCPICRKQLTELQNQLAEFDKRGVKAIAISSDNAERAGKTVETWELDKLPVGYGLDLETARQWGLYVSSGRGTTSIGVEEPALFSEPGLFLIKPDNTVYFASVQTMPFARPHFTDILAAIDFVLAKDYPARGEVENLKAIRAA
ncbi:MAG: peroxiredoxin-like family protein [Tepidamorphaceae bacterium]